MPDLPPQPEPQTESPELYPGGVDALDDESEVEHIPRDLDPERNAATGDKAPEEVEEQDDKQQEPDSEEDATDEPPA